VITAVVTGDREVVARLQALPSAVHRAVARTIERVLLMLVVRVKRDKLSGQVLKNRTGQLRQSITKDPAVGVHEDADGVSGRVGIFGGPTLGYGRAHEFGFSGTVAVPEHWRLQSHAWGQPIAPRSVLVSAHSMKLNLPERSFLRSALDDMRGDIDRDLRAAVALGVAGGV
jgi:hypothetical protein